MKNKWGILGICILILGFHLKAEQSDKLQVSLLSDNEPTIKKETFDQALKKKKLGIDLESPKYRGLKSYAQSYLLFKQNKLSSSAKSELIVSCLVSHEKNPFCAVIADESEMGMGSSFTSDGLMKRETRPPLDLDTIGELIVAEEFKKLYQYSRSSILRSLRKFDTWESLTMVANAAISGSQCAPAVFLTALGQKAEEFFPEERFVQLAMKLYKKAHQCGELKDESTTIARYRYALLNIWKQDCDEALPFLKALEEGNDDRFHTRVLYWSGYCLQKEDSVDESEVYVEKMMVHNPLSMHAISMHAKKEYPIEAVQPDQPPEVYFRSENDERLNQYLRSIEVLYRMKKSGYAQELLRRIEPELKKDLPEVKLYGALLAKWVGSQFVSFRMLSLYMKEVPQSIHEKVFVQFYPYKYKKWIKRYAKGIDPYLIAALIRQESGFLPGIRSPAGAVGLMQLLPSTARMMKRRVNRWSLKRPALNIRLGTKYLKRLVKRYDGETELALAAYNAGPQNVDQWLRRYPVHNRMLFLDLIPFAETRNYVVLIGRNYHWYRRLYSTRTPATQKVSAKFEALESFLQ